ncbi:hypothetical protein D9611_000321 [Ephemerocybe angulata]|uniref:Uncharacterized protein n=1 Tax=Ephemerocybe angulata TaxID=980116 RepID=A0A8H5BPT0_9AGAR|nr:hypothetical protein D9611_000321 [Tulosesus angulatus]
MDTATSRRRSQRILARGSDRTSHPAGAAPLDIRVRAQKAKRRRQHERDTRDASPTGAPRSAPSLLSTNSSRTAGQRLRQKTTRKTKESAVSKTRASRKDHFQLGRGMAEAAAEYSAVSGKVNGMYWHCKKMTPSTSTVARTSKQQRSYWVREMMWSTSEATLGAAAQAPWSVDTEHGGEGTLTLEDADGWLSWGRSVNDSQHTAGVLRTMLIDFHTLTPAYAQAYDILQGVDRLIHGTWAAYLTLPLVSLADGDTNGTLEDTLRGNGGSSQAGRRGIDRVFVPGDFRRAHTFTTRPGVLEGRFRTTREVAAGPAGQSATVKWDAWLPT